MKLSRRLRAFAAFLALASVLVSQLALAAYACPGSQGMAMAGIALAGNPDATSCGDGVADPQPALCSAHCQQGDQSLDKPAVPPVPALDSVDLAFDIAANSSRTPAHPPGEQASLLARATAPSVAVRHCCFRI